MVLALMKADQSQSRILPMGPTRGVYTRTHTALMPTCKEGRKLCSRAMRLANSTSQVQFPESGSGGKYKSAGRIKKKMPATRVMDARVRTRLTISLLVRKTNGAITNSG